MKNLRKNLFIFLCFWIICGLFASTYVQLPYFDWSNYHYYNCWAFLNNRYDLDFLAANHRTYFIPYVDIIQYLILNKLNNHPLLFLFLDSWDNAFVLTLVYKIGDLIFNNQLKEKFYLILYAIVFVTISPIFFLLSNFSMNDMTIAGIILCGLYLLLKNLFNKNCPKRLWNILFSGLIFGCALALKLTSAVYILAVIFVLLILFRRIEKPFKTIGLFCLGVTSSFVLISGHWYWNIYKHFQNPFLPYFNDIFKSDYAQHTHFVNIDFEHVKARNLKEFIFFPFLVGSSEHRFGNSEFSFDPRYIAAIFGALSLIPFLIYQEKLKTNERFNNLINFNHLWFLICFTLLAYYINCAIFATYRYIAASYVLYGFIIIAYAYAITGKIYNKKFFITSFLTIIILSAIYFTDFGIMLPHKNNSTIDKIISVKDYKIKDNSYVFLFDHLTSVIVPFQNPTAHYRIIAYPKNFDYSSFTDIGQVDFLGFTSKYLYTASLYKKTKEILDSNSNVYIILFYNSDTVKDYKKALQYYSKNNRKIKNCKSINYDILYMKDISLISICEYNKK